MSRLNLWPFVQPSNRAAIILFIALFGAGCERVALVGRDPPKLEPLEIVVEVERVDSHSKQIHLRSNSDGIGMVEYGDDTRVIYRGHELPPDQLQAGDVIAMIVEEDPPSRHRTEFLTIRERRGSRDGVR